MNFATLRMSALGAERNAMRDDVRDIDELNAVADAEPEPSMMSFFNGKPYAEGLKAYNEYLASKR